MGISFSYAEQRELEFCPEESFETGIRKTVDWYLHHEEWWRSVMDGRYRTWTARHYGLGS